MVIGEVVREPSASDPRWRLAQTVVAGPHFSRSPLLSKFLLYVVNETIEGRESGITEHQIGVAVFGRPAGYRTDDDNIVRNYARQIRKRLCEHFAGAGRDEAMRIEIPVGGYVPVFRRASPVAPGEPALSEPCLVPDPPPGEEIGAKRKDAAGFALWRPLAVCGIVIAFCALWFGYDRRSTPMAAHNEEREFWQAVLPRTGNTYLVPPDVGLNLMEDMTQQTMPLASYVRDSYREVRLANIDEHTQEDLHGQQYTDFVSMQMVAVLARRPEYDPNRVVLRFPRDLRMDDLKNANALIIGSADANPWASLSESHTTFHIEPRDQMESASIVNDRPSRGEQRIYQSHWNEAVHETYGLIQFLPNLSGSGHLLFVQGLDVAGTQAAAECLFHTELMRPVLKEARRPDGSFRSFEILLRATSMQSNAEGATILASRVE